jgi:glycosidase
MRGMPLARTARDRLAVSPVDPVATSGIGPDLAATRQLAARVVEAGDAPGVPASAGELAAIGLLHEILHRLTTRIAARSPERGPDAISRRAVTTAGARTASTVRRSFEREFPNAAEGEPLSELLLVRVANENPAASPYRWLFDDRSVVGTSTGSRMLAALEAAAVSGEAVGPAGETLLELLRAPAKAAPTSLAGQLRYIRDHWRGLFGGDLDDLLDRATLLLDVIAEEERGLHLRFGGATGGPAGGEAPGLGDGTDPVRFSSDLDWMPRLVLLAKSTYVWLDQLSKRHGRDIRTLDAIPDEELDRLARWGISGLWLIGLWERSRASERIKRLRGNPEAVASAYSLDDYRIAADLGGEAAWADLARRAWERGIRLGSDMVPNHMGIDSRWVIEHPERFLSLPEPPYPAYSYGGPDLSDDERVAIRIEDHYWDGSDAAVVFQRVDTGSGDVRYVYHGNDGTSMPWNDTAQLDYSRADVREAVIATILDVARHFPIIRFDAAMTLAKRHVQRLWFPTPGAGGAIPSRAEHGMPRPDFEAAMPTEFWRDVVDRVAAEAPDTLLLAEAFWLMEGYFVRTLGMHRVYNSAFMHMLRDEDGPGFRKVLRDTLEFDPEILKRYVNFMNNPDERTAVEQFGKGDKYFGVATLLATLPGLPMLGHGQVEGFAEKYGMEYRRAYHDETPDEGLLAAHERWVFPLLHRRAQFAEARDFLLYDLVRDDGATDEHVVAYSNGRGPSRSLVVYHLRSAETAGTIRTSVPYSVPDGGSASDGRRLVRRTLAEGWGIADDADPGLFIRARDQAGDLEYLWRATTLRDEGLRLALRAYGRRVYLDVAEVRDGPDGLWTRLHDRLAGGGVPSLDRARRELELADLHRAVGELVGDLAILGLIREGRSPDPTALDERLGVVAMEVRDATGVDGEPAAFTRPATRRLDRLGELVEMPRSDLPEALAPVASAFGDPAHRAVLAGWALLASLGGLARAASPASTSWRWYDDLLLEPVVAGAIAGAGLSADAARRSAARLQVLLDLPRPSDVAGPTELLDAWLDRPAVRGAIGWNEWQGEAFVAREGWRELLDWALLLDAVDGVGPEGLAASGAIVNSLAEAGEAAGYRVADIRMGLGERTAGRPRPVG